MVWVWVWVCLFELVCWLGWLWCVFYLRTYGLLGAVAFLFCCCICLDDYFCLDCLIMLCLFVIEWTVLVWFCVYCVVVLVVYFARYMWVVWLYGVVFVAFVFVYLCLLFCCVIWFCIVWFCCGLLLLSVLVYFDWCSFVWMMFGWYCCYVVGLFMIAVLLLWLAVSVWYSLCLDLQLVLSVCEYCCYMIRLGIGCFNLTCCSLFLCGWLRTWVLIWLLVLNCFGRLVCVDC